jgi:uncharacterized protein
MVKRSALSHNAGFDALNCPTMKKTPPLTDADINDIDELLAAVPAPFETVDAVILDGYLAGVLVQPVMLTPEQDLPPIFGTEGMPEAGIPGWTKPSTTSLIGLIDRRKDEILRGILENGWFDPIIPMMEDEDGKPAEGKDALEGIGYWAAGFEWALANFPQLEESSAGWRA